MKTNICHAHYQNKPHCMVNDCAQKLQNQRSEKAAFKRTSAKDCFSHKNCLKIYLDCAMCGMRS